MKLSLPEGLEHALRWIGDRFVVGLMVLVGSIGLVTVPAALAAGARACRASDLADAAHDFRGAYWSAVRRGLLSGMLVVLLESSSIVSLAVAAPSTRGVERAFAVVIGLATWVWGLLLAAYAAAAIESGVPPRLIDLAQWLLATPGRAARVVAINAVLVLALPVVLIAVPPLMALLGRQIAVLAAGPDRRDIGGRSA